MALTPPSRFRSLALRHSGYALAICLGLVLLLGRLATAQLAVDATDSTGIAAPESQDAEGPGAGDKALPADAPQQKQPPKLPPPPGATALPDTQSIWVDRQKHTVYVDGVVSLRQGLLEMFACPRGTKEHESVVALDVRAQWVHTALLLAGAESGKPVQFIDEYHPPTGDVIDIQVQWLDPQGKKHTAPAKSWVRDAKRGKAMQADWVFAGSGFWTDEETGQKYYMAEGGDLICVANFSTATLDVAVKSTQANEGLLYEAFTDHVPALGTPIRLVMKPRKQVQDGQPQAEASAGQDE